MSDYRPTLKAIRDSHQWKRHYEKYLPLSRFFFRPIGFLVTWLAVRVGLTSEVVSWLSAIVGLIGCSFLVSGKMYFVYLGVGLLLVFNILDCVDGSIARAMKTENPYGRFLDSICGEMVDVLFWTIIGILAYKHHNLLRWPDVSFFGASLWLVFGIASSFLYIQIHYIERTFDELLRIHWEQAGQKDNNPGATSFRNKNEKASPDGIVPLRIIINNNLRVRENHYVLLVVALLIKSVDIFLSIYFIYYLALYVVLVVSYSVRGRLVRKIFSSHPSDDRNNACKN